MIQIKIFPGLDFRKYIEVWYNKDDDRPCDYFSDRGIYKVYYYLKDEIYQWMKENNIEYVLEFQGSGTNLNAYWYLEMKPVDAMLFKLTWG